MSSLIHIIRTYPTVLSPCQILTSRHIQSRPEVTAPKVLRIRKATSSTETTNSLIVTVQKKHIILHKNDEA